MRILFIMPSMNSGGAERTVSYLASYMANNGLDVTIMALTGGLFYSVDEKVKFVSLNIKRTFANMIERLYLVLRRYIGVNAHLCKHNYDVVICLLPESARYIMARKKHRKFALITSERNNPAIVTDPGEIKAKNKIYSISDGIIFQTERAREYYSEQIRKKGVVIHNAVGNEYVHQIPDVICRKKKIVAIGRLAAQKDYPTLFEAFNIVLNRYPEYVLEIFGDGPERDKIIEYAVNLGIREQVIFQGVHKDAIVKASDSMCYVMSSKYEGMPNALMEAMAVGLPCVSTDCPNGPSELIQNKKNGLLVPVGDVTALADAIIKMIEDREFAEMCSKNAKMILDTHSLEKQSDKYMQYILKIYNKELL